MTVSFLPFPKGEGRLKQEEKGKGEGGAETRIEGKGEGVSERGKKEGGKSACVWVRT